MLNKILLRKIKFPLSWRAKQAFPHVIARERSDRSNLNNKGFSLIELMVAVVILAMAIFGIFQAYSVGFMGMADARDRTVAVNYIQKTLEEYKNTPFNKITDKRMSLIPGTKFSNGSFVINMSKPGEETHLKKIITQVRWPDRNGNIKIEEASTLIYSAPKTGEILSASEIIFYASPYYRILPDTFTTLTAEIHDANGNIVTNWRGRINFTILSGDTLGYLAPVLVETTNGIASVKYYSNLGADGSVSIQASADLDGVGGDDVFDTITITISTGAEGIILVPSTEYSSVGTSVEVNLYVVDASFDYQLGGGSHIITGYDGIISLNVSGPASLSTTTITTLNGRASFMVNSNGTPGAVEITASAPDLDIGYTKVNFTGGAQSIQLTPKYGSIYEGESIEITITILDENKNPTPFSGSITITSDNGGSFNPISPITFANVSFKTVDFMHNIATEGIEITATGGGLTSNSIYIDVLDSLTPSYLELTAIPMNVKAGGVEESNVTATVYDNSNPAAIVTNYANQITFSVSGGSGYFINENGSHVYSINVNPHDGQAHINLYSTSSGTTTVNATSGGITQDSINIIFYSVASGLKISTSKGTVIANGVDYSIITVEIIDNNNYVVSDYIGKISLSTTKGYFEVAGTSTTTLNFTNEGSKFVKLFSNSGISENAIITASANITDAGFSATASASVAFTQPAVKNITFVEGSVESVSAYKIIKFDIKVTGADVNLSKMLISWAAVAKLEKIEIMSPKSSGTYQTTKVTNGVIGVSSPYTYENINTTLYYAEPELSTIRLTFLSKNNVMRYETIYVTFYDNEKNYPITVYVPK